MQYTKRDLKSVDLFAQVLVGIGVLFLVFGMILLSGEDAADKGKDGKAIAYRVSGESREKEIVVKKTAMSTPGLPQIVLGIVFQCLGGALSLGVRRVIKNNGRDVDEYGNVPA